MKEILNWVKRESSNGVLVFLEECPCLDVVVVELHEVVVVVLSLREVNLCTTACASGNAIRYDFEFNVS
jgi:hypothetical protein